MSTQEIIFGPVPSRRLGSSLGVDIVPLKTCTYECVYCQVGKTTRKTLLRESYFNPAMVIEELKKALDSAKKVDYITFSGSGEPTLHSEIGKIVSEIKAFTAVKIAVITNGSLLHLEEVRRDLAEADLVIPSVDAATQPVFEKINRPVDGLEIATVNQGIIDFSQQFGGAIWIESLFVEGANDSDDEVKAIADVIGRVKAEKVQINTVIRPPFDSSARTVSRCRLEEIRTILSRYHSHVETITDFVPKAHGAMTEEFEKQVMALLRRRPCTPAELSDSLGIRIAELNKYLDNLLRKKVVTVVKIKGKEYLAIRGE